MISSRNIFRSVFVALVVTSAAAGGQAKPAKTARPAPRQPLFTEILVEAEQAKFPIKIPKRGPVTLQLQIMLDRAGFSPGIIDGEWGINAAKAMTFFTYPDNKDRLTGDSPPAVTSVDKATYDRLRSAARQKPALLRYPLSAEDVAGPFTTIPSSVYEQAKLACLCYSSTLELLSERFHVSRKLLAELNPRVNFDKLRKGTVVTVPNVEYGNTALPQDTAIIARVIISKKHFWTHAVDSEGKIIYHFPSTLGAGYDPSPTGDFRVTWVSRDPSFKYQPKLFAEVPDTDPEAKLPAGPNSPVGLVWMSLSKPHYGIHGTSSPETIGYANSHGCVRLTNWDALRLSDLVDIGTPVQFK